jgi:hypothetical protein
MLEMLAPARPMMAPASLGATIRRSSISVERTTAVEGAADDEADAVAARVELESDAVVDAAAESAAAAEAAVCGSASFLKRLAMVSSDEEEAEEEDSADSAEVEAGAAAACVAASAPSAPLSSSLLRFMSIGSIKLCAQLNWIDSSSSGSVALLGCSDGASRTILAARLSKARILGGFRHPIL